MSAAFESRSGKSLLSCRRSGHRFPLPVEVQIQINDRFISGIVRDVTIDDTRRSTAVGISLMHFEPLSVNREYVCRTIADIDQLPEEFTVSVRWCRYFEDEAYISGGVVL